MFMLAHIVLIIGALSFDEVIAIIALVVASLQASGTASDYLPAGSSNTCDAHTNDRPGGTKQGNDGPDSCLHRYHL